MGKITLLPAAAPPRDIPLNKPRISIGRRSHNDIHLDDPAVSGEHAVILRLADDAVVEDLDSTNGTRVNGQPVKKHFLQDGDVIGVATHRMVYHSESVTPEPGVPMFEVSSGKDTGMRTMLAQPITVIEGTGGARLLIIRNGPDYLLIAEAAAGSLRVNGRVVGVDGCRLTHGDVVLLPEAELNFHHPRTTTT